MILCFVDSIPSKYLPHQVGHHDETDYIYYDREDSDKATTIMLEVNKDIKDTNTLTGKENEGCKHR